MKSRYCSYRILKFSPGHCDSSYREFDTLLWPLQALESQILMKAHTLKEKLIKSSLLNPPQKFLAAVEGKHRDPQLDSVQAVRDQEALGRKGRVFLKPSS